MTTLNEEAPAASATSASTAAKQPKSGWRWLAYIFVGLFLGFPLGSIIAGIGAMVSKHNREIWLRTMATSILSLVLSVVLYFGVGAILGGHNSSLNSLPSVSAPTQSAPTTPQNEQAPPSAPPVASSSPGQSGLSLPTESMTEEPATTVQHLVAIFNRAVATGNYNYLSHYYANPAAFWTAASWQQWAQAHAGLKETFLTNTPDEHYGFYFYMGPGSSFEGVYFLHFSDGSPDEEQIFYFAWYPQVHEWLITKAGTPADIP